MQKQQSPRDVQGQYSIESIQAEDNADFEDLSSTLSNQCNTLKGSMDSIEYLKGSLVRKTYQISNSRQICGFSDRLSYQENQSYDDEDLLYRKIQKKDTQFKSDKLSSTFIKYINDSMQKFFSSPSEKTFLNFIQCVGSFKQRTIFKRKDTIEDKSQIQQILEDFFYRNKNLFLIFTFDFFLCHLSFICSYVYYWLSIQNRFKNQGQKLFANIKKKTIKVNFLNILKGYVEERSQQINLYQPVLLIVYYFFQYLKTQKIQRIGEILHTQKKLLANMRTYRKLKKQQNQFSESSHKIVFQSQLHKFQHGNKLISSIQQTYLLLKLITLSNLASSPLVKYYRLYGFQNNRQQYQHKKDTFCIWILEIVERIAAKNTSESLYKASYYIMMFFVILKRFKTQNNLEGISYIVPILSNLKILLPKVWNYACERRNEINSKLDQYTSIMLKKQLHREQFMDCSSVIIWDETIYQFVDKYRASLLQQKICLCNHLQFYKNFLKPIFFYRKKVQREYQIQTLLYNKDRQIGINFNIYLLDSYLPSKLYKNKKIKEQWKKLEQKCQQTNNLLSNSLYASIIDYCFIGSSVKYQQFDL